MDAYVDCFKGQDPQRYRTVPAWFCRPGGSAVSCFCCGPPFTKAPCTLTSRAPEGSTVLQDPHTGPALSLPSPHTTPA